MKPESLKMEGVKCLKELFTDRGDTNAVVINWLFIGGHFCYIEKEGEEEITFRLKDLNNHSITMKAAFDNRMASIVEVSIDPALDATVYVAPLLLEVVTKGINKNKTSFLIKIAETRKQSFLRAMKECGFAIGGKYEKGAVLRRFDLVRNAWPVSMLLWAKRNADEHVIETSDTGEELEGRTCSAVSCMMNDGVYYYVMQDDDEDGETTFILENKRFSCIYVLLQYSSAEELKIFWNAPRENMHKTALCCAMMDRILLHALHRNVKLIQCRFECADVPAILKLAGYSRPPRVFPPGLINALHMYGFVAPSDKLMLLEL